MNSSDDSMIIFAGFVLFAISYLVASYMQWRRRKKARRDS